MNLVLRELTAASMTLTRTGATAQSQAVAQANASSQQFNVNSHPRGADGRFIQTGGTVQVLGGPDGKTPIAEGTATVIESSQGPLIQVKSATTGQITTVSPSQIQAAPQSIATLGAKGTQGIPTTPAGAASAARADARNGIPPRSGKNALGEQANPTIMAAYLAAYKTEQALLQKRAAAKAKTAANKAAAAKKKAAAANSPTARTAPKEVLTRSTRSFYK